MSRLQEHHLYVILIVLMNLCYLYSSFLSESLFDQVLFGFNQLSHISFLLLLLFYIITGSTIFWVETVLYKLQMATKIFLKVFNAKRGIFVIISLFFFLIFLNFRNEFVNPDGLKFPAKFSKDVFRLGAHVTHDQMLELYIHSRFWYYTHLLWGWSVRYSYQFLSAFVGGIFVFILQILTQKITEKLNRRFLAFFCLTISGGFMQLFFGDVENYTLVSLVILLYFFSAFLFLKREWGIIMPSIILSLAICCHLLAGWLIPSLLYLYFVATKRKLHYHVALGGVSFLIIFLLTLLFFHFHSLPIRNLYYHSHALGHGGNIKEMLVQPSIGYYWQIINLLFLIFPSVYLFIPLLKFKRINTTDPFNIFLIFSSSYMLIFMFIWNAAIGVYNDWNLFAPVAIPLSILCWYNYIQIEGLKHKTRISLGIFYTSAIHSYSWIISNHFY